VNPLTWAGPHPVLLGCLLAVAFLSGVIVAAACAAAHDGDSAADKAIRQRVAANRAKRAARVESNYPPLDDEHHVHVGI
jgi:hypothetical protein